VPNATIAFERAEMIVKVKEPLAPERKRFRRGQILFTYRILPPIGSRRLTSSPRASPPSLMQAIETLCRRADLVIGAVLVPGGKAPKLISAVTVKAMKQGAVIVDVSIDQGGVAETSRPTTHSHPTYVVYGVVHYCVANMLGAVARTSTLALSGATSSFVLELADKGWARALEDDPYLRDGLNIHNGMITYRAVAEALELPYVPAEEALMR
jgi:alanine dehydrogenase